MPAFPVDLRVAGRRAPVVGGGRVAARRVEALRLCGAQVTSVSPELVAARRLRVRTGDVEHRARAFEPGDGEGMDLIVSSADDPAVAPRVHAEARRVGALVNVADV